jgi:dinuclear metal center YbgI/SA1388 family protein
VENERSWPEPHFSTHFTPERSSIGWHKIGGFTQEEIAEMADLESILHFLEETFEVSTFPDYPNALNGLQVSGPKEVGGIGVAVDATERTIQAALESGADLLIVHHGLFWEGFGPLTGPRFRKVAALIKGGMGLYSLHLPLDAHPELGNCALLTESMGLTPAGRFGEYQGREVGWWAEASLRRDVLRERAAEAVKGEVRLVPGGPEVVERVGVLTGGAASSLAEAAEMGLDALVTGEGSHHHFHEAMELGVNLYLAGHYATETFGVKAVGETLSDRFSLGWEFLQSSTGM